jgi:NAD+ kinase
MNFALFGKNVAEPAVPFVQELISNLQSHGGGIYLYQPLAVGIRNQLNFNDEPVIFSTSQELEGQVDFLISIGGDGTILEALSLVGDSGIPVAGINMGRLGFLSVISKEQISPAVEAIINGHYKLEARSLLHLEFPANLFGGLNFALNDLTVYKANAMTMLTIKTWINGDFLNAYWADGLIVATPTGSTAYSLSCTGPIITPDSDNFLITPIASHNLTVRPIVVRDDSEIRIRVEGKTSDFLVSLDSRVERVDHAAELTIRKAPFRINLLRLNEKNFFQTIREKLNWGLDNRN